MLKEAGLVAITVIGLVTKLEAESLLVWGDLDWEVEAEGLVDVSNE